METLGTILAVDVGTTAIKMGVFHAQGGSLQSLAGFSQAYEIRTYNDGLFSDIDPRKWQEAFLGGCRRLGDYLKEVDVISLSGTTPGLTAMDSAGNALYPAILMLDQRSRQQAQQIVDAVGLQTLLEVTGNMPVAGGCSLASILWLKDHEPGIFRKAAVFGHSNTFMARWLGGGFAIDPSSASLTALYRTVRNDLSWDETLAAVFDLDPGRLPRVIPSHGSAGRVSPPLAGKLGLVKEPPIVIGGNDAVLAAYSAGSQEPGDIVNVNGTCEITLVCLPRCLPSPNYNVRAHVLPQRWLTLHVMNAGGTALEWFRSVFCSELNASDFYEGFLPAAVDGWLEKESAVSYVPFLLGSRYSLEPLKAEFRGLTAESTREELLAALIRGLCLYQRRHLDEIGPEVPLKDLIHVTGGAAGPAMVRAKKAWMKNCRYVFEEESSLRGAALLGLKFLEESATRRAPA